MAIETEELVTLNGHTFTAFRGDFISRKIAMEGLYEKELLSAVRELLKQFEDPIVLDIGANVGNHALDFSMVSKQVYSFEPIFEIYQLLDKNIKQNKIHNVKAINCALSNEKGSDEIFLAYSGNTGGSSFHNRAEKHERIKVDKQVGDDVIAELSLAKIDLIKIDVEGHEFFVLKGLEKTIEQFEPFIIMEWADDETRKRLVESGLLAQLKKDYDIHVIGSNWDKTYWNKKFFGKIRRKIVKATTKKQSALYDFDENILFDNILFVPKSKISIIEVIRRLY